MNLRVLYLHQYFCTPQGSSGTRSYEFARAWVKAGARVRVITGKSFDDSLPANSTVKIEGVSVKVLGTGYKPTMGFFQRVMAFLSFAFRASFHTLRSEKVNVVLATSTPLTIAIPGLLAVWLRGLPMIFEVRDVWPDAAVEAGVLKSKILIWLAHKLELQAYRSSDHVVALSTGMKDRIVAKGVPENKITVIPNSCDLERFRPKGLRDETRKAHGVSDSFVVLYCGAINQANCIEDLACLVQRLKSEADIVFWFVGGGNKFSQLKEAVKDCPNACFMGKKPKESLPALFEAADLGLVTFIHEPVYYENSPNKFFDYIAAGLPVLFNRSTWLQPFIEEYQAGFVSTTGVAGMSETILRLKVDPVLQRALRQQARRLAVERFSRAVMAKTYLELLASFASLQKTDLK